MIIPKTIINQMVEHARREAPYECCGLLTGFESRIDEIVFCTNLKESEVEFSVPPEELFDVFRDLRRRGRKLLGIYHSHPGTPAAPSPRDVEEFHYHDIDYWIVSLQNHSPVVRCFRWEDGSFQETRFQVFGDG